MYRSKKMDELFKGPPALTLKDPWQDLDGLPLSDEMLKQVTATWSSSDWEKYLQTLEVPVKESQPDLKEINRTGLCRNISDLWANGISKSQAAILNRLIESLTTKQAFVIRKIYLEGLSDQQVATTMGISRQGVFDLKKRAIRQLKRRGKKLLCKIPIVPTQDESKSLATKREEVSSC